MWTKNKLSATWNCWMLSFCDQLSSSVLALLKAKHPTKYTAIKAIRVTINIALALLQGCQQTNFTRVTVVAKLCLVVAPFHAIHVYCRVDRANPIRWIHKRVTTFCWWLAAPWLHEMKKRNKGKRWITCNGGKKWKDNTWLKNPG